MVHIPLGVFLTLVILVCRVNCDFSSEEDRGEGLSLGNVLNEGIIRLSRAGRGTERKVGVHDGP